MSSPKDKKPKKANESAKSKKKLVNQCKNHPNTRAIRWCEECDDSFCNECLTEYWSHNFLSYAYLGESKKFTKEYLCHDCSRKKRRKGVMVASFFLVVLVLFIGFSIYNA